MKKNKLLLGVIFVFIMIIIPNFSLAKNIVVILDPGHGGSDPGTTWGNLKEKDINWKLATKVKEILDATPGITGILSREENECPTLYTRGLVAKDWNADLLVSFHINSSSIPNSSRGAEVYITADTTQDRFNKNSKILGNNILRNLNSIGVPSFWYEPRIKYSTDGELYENGTLSDYYGIIRNPMYYEIPGILIEHCFMNNAQDRANFLSNDSAIDAMAAQDAYAIINNKELFRKEYRGDIATQINNLELLQSEKGSYIKGEILVTEWIDGVTWSKPKEMPKIRIKSTDGTQSYEMWVSNIENNTYYFDGYIDGIDTSKEYEIEVESGSEENTSPYRIAKGYYNENKTLGQYRRHILSVSENVFKFTPTNYCGDIATQIVDTTLEKNEEGRPYLKGEILITEWLGTLWTVPDVTPEMTIISTDGTSQQQFWVKNIESNRYYFDGYIDGLDMTKEYVIRVELKNTYNTSKYQSQNVTYTEDRELGDYQDTRIIIKDSKIIFEREENNEGTYIGDIATQINNIELLQNERGNYIRGEIVITEWIDGVTWSKPRETPKIRIKSTDGSESYEMWVSNIESNTYYFDGYIDGIDTSKEYEIEVESGSEENTSSYRIAKGYYNENKELGMYENKTVKIENNKIVFESETYRGDIATQINSLELLQNERGNYIRGEIVITEWIDGVTWSKPRETPKIRIKSTDGSESYEMWVSNIESNTYYFDGYIDGINTSKEYEIEVESGSIDNVSPYRIAKGYYNENKELGMYKETNMKIENNIISFVEIKENTLREENTKEIMNSNDELVLNEENNIDNQDEKVITEEKTEEITNKTENKDIYENDKEILNEDDTNSFSKMED